MPAPPDERRVLFLQVADPAAYPPVMNAARVMAEAGWQVTLLAAPIASSGLAFAPGAGIELRSIGARPSHVVGRGVYLRYLAEAASLALRRRTHVVYASDPLSAGPALAAARLTGARLVYHEHDSPEPDAPASWVSNLRRRAAERAELVMLPNEARAAQVGAALGVAGKTITVWNLPSRRELPRLACGGAEAGGDGGERLELYYHGSINPERLPEAVVHAIARLGRAARLSIAGYEAPGAAGYVARLVELGAGDGAPHVVYLGEIPERADLLAQATRADVGLAFMPAATADFNMRNMVGASNKPFDYLAAGQALLVSDLPDWREAFAAPGFARACEPTDVAALTEAFAWFAGHPDERRAMGRRGRERIERDWNYETAFAPVLERLSA